MRIASAPLRFCFALFVYAGVAIGTGGCLISSESAETHTGTAVPESTFAQIEPGKTTVGWVEATLGAPTSKSTADNHIVYKYIYRERRESSGAVFLIFGSTKTTESEHIAYVEFSNGVVVNKWRS